MNLRTHKSPWPLVGALLILGSLACSILPSRQAEEASDRLATRTPLPTFTATLAAQAAVSIPPTPTATPTSPPPPTQPPPTPEPPPADDTPTPEPPPTDTPPPPPTKAPEPQPAQQESPAEPPPPAEPAPGAHGVIGKISFRDGRNTYAVGEKVFVKIEAVNTSPGLVPFGILGLTPSVGSFQTSWSSGNLEAGIPFNHEDGLAFPAPGTHKLWLSICFSDKEVCQGPDGDWERFEPGLDVIVQ